MATKKQAEPELKRFEEIIAERLPKQPTTRERLAARLMLGLRQGRRSRRRRRSRPHARSGTPACSRGTTAG